MHILLYTHMKIQWLAGFFDGEGHIGLAKTWDKRLNIKAKTMRVTPNIQISQLNKPILEAIQKEYGYGTIKTYNNMSRLTITGRQRVKSFLQMLRPHLILKAEHTDLVLSVLDKDARTAAEASIKLMHLNGGGTRPSKKEAIFRVKRALHEGVQFTW